MSFREYCFFNNSNLQSSINSFTLLNSFCSLTILIRNKEKEFSNEKRVLEYKWDLEAMGKECKEEKCQKEAA